MVWPRNYMHNPCLQIALRRGATWVDLVQNLNVSSIDIRQEIRSMVKHDCRQRNSLDEVHYRPLVCERPKVAFHIE